jgi:undecaprenyl-diphosphatase
LYNYADKPDLSTNEWVGVAHVLWQADSGGDGRHKGLESLGDFLGSQALVVGPLVFAGLLAAWGYMLNKWKKISSLERFLVVVSLPVFVAFLVLATQSKVQANWPLLATVPGLLVLAAFLARLRYKLLAYLGVFAVVLNGFLGILLLDTAAFRAVGLFPLAAKNDPTKDMRGWVEMGELFGLLLNRLDNPVVMAGRYQTLAPVMFHAPGVGDVAYVRTGGRRANQYDLWPWPDMAGRLVVYVGENRGLPMEVEAVFRQCKPWHALGTEDVHGEVTRQLWTWVCWDVKALPEGKGR